MRNKINKYTSALLAPSNRPFLFVAGGVLFAVSLAFVIFFIVTSSEEDGAKAPLQATPSNSVVNVGAEKSNAYKEAVEQKNKENYDRAIRTQNGVHIPFVIDGKKPEPIAGGDADVSTCGCTMSDAEFHARLSRAGVEFDSDNDLITQIGDSDIYVAADRYLVSDDKQKLKLHGQDVKLSDSGGIVWSDNRPVDIAGVGELFLSVDGEIIDKETNLIPMRGQLLTHDGVVLLANGHFAYRAGNMVQVDTTDIYITSESQLVTVDARPIRHSGNFVFRNREREITDSRGVPARWENNVVFQSNAGHLVDNTGTTFTKPGIIFSFNGIMIDNFGMLTEPLTNLRRVGDSDILLDDNGNLKDRFSGAITYYSASVKLGIGQRLLSGATNLKNHKNASVLLEDDGRLSVDIGKGSVQSGLLKNSNGVAYDRNGHLLSRPGKLSQKGTSDVFISSDGLLASVGGKPLLFKHKDMFLDFNTYLPNKLIGLRTYDLAPVTDKQGNRLYIDELGRFVTKDNKLAQIGVDLTSSEGVVLSSTGEMMMDRDARKPVLSKSGEQLFYNGKAVFEGVNGQLFDADGNPIFDEHGGPLRLNEQGFIVDENGELSGMKGFSTKSGKIDPKTEQFDVIKPLLGPDGKQVYRNGKPVFRKGNILLDENGNQLRDESGSLLTVAPDGTIQNEFGVPDAAINDQLTNPSHGSGNHKSASVPKELVTLNGKPLTHNGKQVYRRPDGALVYANGEAVKGVDGRELYLDENMRLKDKTGKEAISPWDEGALSTIANGGFEAVNPLGRSYESGFIKTEDGYILDKNGKPLTYKGKNVRVGADGRIYDEDGNIVTDSKGNPLFMNDKGEIITEDGEPVKEAIFADGDGRLIFGNGKPVTSAMKKIGDSDVYITRDGKLLDKEGRPFKYNGKAIEIDPETGRLIDEDGNPLRDPRGNSLYLSEAGEFITKDGKKASGITPVDAQGVALGADGKLLAGSKQLTKIPGTEYYKSEEGLVVDENGKPVLRDGKHVYVDATNQLVDRLKRPIRYRGQRLRLDGRGQVVGANGDSIIIDEKPVTLSNLDLLSDDGIAKDSENNVTPPSLPEEPAEKSEVTNVSSKDTEENKDLAKKAEETQTDDGKIKLSAVDQAARSRFGERVASYIAAMEKTAKSYEKNITPTFKPTDVTTAKAPGMPSQESTQVSPVGSDSNTGAKSIRPQSQIVEPTGSTFFVATTHALNTDFNDRLEVEIHMPFPEHPLHLAKAYAIVDLVYDNAVLKFNQICPLELKCFSTEGLALDPSTASAGMAAEVDDHFWYRFGGVFLASFGTGVADGVANSQDRTQITDSIPGSTSTTTIVEGLNYAEIALQGVGEVGRALLPSLAERVNRPVTVRIPQNTEMVMKIFTHITDKDLPTKH
ncbi:hypothetical protein [Salinimonas chungwhensis]|uniref:hypothetical protein n=1 Tax=Salinimonas chungwhensis TaxID=265425 RepID=UPI000381C00B|nr:hypothetical protein [Salinimonas chungwhensis]